MRILFTALLLLALGYIALCGLLYLFQDSLVFFPVRGHVATPGERGMTYEDVRMETSEGVGIHGWFVQAPEERGVVLFCHGNGGNISYSVESAALLRSLGLSVFLFDYEGYGESGGEPGEEGTYRSAEAAWRHLTEERKIPSSRIVVHGHSLGGGVASRLAVRHEPAALILESTFSTIADAGADHLPFMPVRLLSRYSYDNIANVRALRRPLLVIHSPDDETIPYRCGLDVYEAGRGPKEFLRIRGGHNDGYIVTGAEYTEGIGRFLDRYLGK